jgi:hypothetical protein
MNGISFFEQNKTWWNLLPGGKRRRNVESLLKYPDWWLKFRYNRFKKFWEKDRYWEYERYSKLFAGKNVLEIGGGLGYDGIVYSKTAKAYTYAELNNKQLSFIRRITALYGVNNAHFEWMDTIEHHFQQTYNAFYAHGVLHHVPFETARQEFKNIDRFLEKGALVVFLMYPKQRWEHWGCPSFETFGNYTDGGCPWAEWYDEEKILALVGSEYELKQTKYWGWKNIEFVNFELLKK